MTPDDVKALRKATGLTQRDLAEALSLEVSLVRDWEKGDRFPTKAHCEAMEKLRENPPPKKPGKGARRARTPMQVLGDPALYTVLRKLLAHDALRDEVFALAEKYPDPLDEADRAP